MKMLAAIFVAFLLIATIDGVLFLNQPLLSSAKKDVEYSIKPGSSLKSILRDLSIYQISRPKYLVILSHLLNNDNQIQAGDYLLKINTKPLDFFKKITSGDVVEYRFTIIEGWTFDHIKQALKKEAHATQTLETMNPQELKNEFALKSSIFDGAFFPDTYHYHGQNSDIDILNMAHQRMSIIVNQLWKNKANNLPYTSADEAITMASIIEKETSIEQEKPIIAGVFINRLAKKMKLQADPTVRYALKYLKNEVLTKDDLKLDSPYNTYKYRGLPPSPICMPGLSSIDAALHPSETKFIYFVADGSGKHLFSETLKEHINNIQKIKKSNMTKEIIEKSQKVGS